jgi:hypothetical protein
MCPRELAGQNDLSDSTSGVPTKALTHSNTKEQPIYSYQCSLSCMPLDIEEHSGVMMGVADLPRNARAA